MTREYLDDPARYIGGTVVAHHPRHKHVPSRTDSSPDEELLRARLRAAAGSPVLDPTTAAQIRSMLTDRRRRRAAEDAAMDESWLETQ